MTPAERSPIEPWDGVLRALWDPSLQTALGAAERLFAPDPGEPSYQSEIDYLAPLFLRELNSRTTAMPPLPEERYACVTRVLWDQLDAERTARAIACSGSGEPIEVILRSVRRLRPAALVDELCLLLIDFHRGVWMCLPEPGRYSLRQAICRTLAALPADRLQPFWERLNSP